jgi:ribosomal 50S subunit-associated protein YjgA (DUF615 family)
VRLLRDEERLDGSERALAWIHGVAAQHCRRIQRLASWRVGLVERGRQ